MELRAAYHCKVVSFLQASSRLHNTQILTVRWFIMTDIFSEDESITSVMLSLRFYQICQVQRKEYYNL